MKFGHFLQNDSAFGTCCCSTGNSHNGTLCVAITVAGMIMVLAASKSYTIQALYYGMIESVSLWPLHLYVFSCKRLHYHTTALD